MRGHVYKTSKWGNFFIHLKMVSSLAMMTLSLGSFPTLKRQSAVISVVQNRTQMLLKTDRDEKEKDAKELK
jgi:hypothetical protein